MTEEQLGKFREAVDRCPASFDEGTCYADGGRDYTHGLYRGSAPCADDCPGRHYQSPDGEIFPDVYIADAYRQQRNYRRCSSILRDLFRAGRRGG